MVCISALDSVYLQMLHLYCNSQEAHFKMPLFFFADHQCLQDRDHGHHYRLDDRWGSPDLRHRQKPVWHFTALFSSSGENISYVYVVVGMVFVWTDNSLNHHWNMVDTKAKARSLPTPGTRTVFAILFSSAGECRVYHQYWTSSLNSGSLISGALNQPDLVFLSPSCLHIHRATKARSPSPTWLFRVTPAPTPDHSPPTKAPT